MTRKDWISTIYITILTVIALVYGFANIPSPSVQRQIALDHQRVSDLGDLRTTIETYYTDNNELPKSLDDLQTNSAAPTQTLRKSDPVTHLPYEYKIISQAPPTVQLCATFTTDSHNENTGDIDGGNYNWPLYASDYQHSSGHYCFKRTIRNSAATPTPTLTPAKIK